LKISAFPKCWIDEISSGKMDLHEWIDLSRQLECDGLELYGSFLRSHEDTYLAEVRAHVAECGMEIPMMCCSPDFTLPDEAQRMDEVRRQQEMIRVSKKLGCRFVRVLSGQKWPEVSIDDGVRMVVDCIRRCLPCAGEEGIVLAMENHYKDGAWHYPEFAQKIAVFMAIINQIDSPWFGVQFDPSNTLVADEDPLELLELVSARVVTMHASDRYVLPGYDLREVLSFAGQRGYHPALKHGVIGRGLNNYPAIFAKLAESGFNGWVSVEDGMNGLEEMKESVDFLKEMRRQYF